MGDELGAVVTTDELMGPSLLHQLLQGFHDINRRDGTVHLQGEAFPGVFIQNREPLEAASSLGLIEDEVVAPDMIDPFGPLPLRPIGTLPKLLRLRARGGTFSPSFKMILSMVKSATIRLNREVIRPAMERRAVVLCDRFLDSMV